MKRGLHMELHWSSILHPTTWDNSRVCLKRKLSKSLQWLNYFPGGLNKHSHEGSTLGSAPPGSIICASSTHKKKHRVYSFLWRVQFISQLMKCREPFFHSSQLLTMIFIRQSPAVSRFRAAASKTWLAKLGPFTYITQYPPKGPARLLGRRKSFIRAPPNIAASFLEYIYVLRGLVTPRDMVNNMWNGGTERHYSAFGNAAGFQANQISFSYISHMYQPHQCLDSLAVRVPTHVRSLLTLYTIQYAYRYPNNWRTIVKVKVRI